MGYVEQSAKSCKNWKYYFVQLKSIRNVLYNTQQLIFLIVAVGSIKNVINQEKKR